MADRVAILYDSVSPNTGDIAIGIALQQALATKNIGVDIIDPYQVGGPLKGTVIVGGGQLLRDPGDSFYDHFRVTGKHILNSIGVSGTEDFSYLDQYQYVSVRSSAEAEIIQKYTSQKVHVVPCTTTILESDLYKIPGLKREKDEIVVGIHLVPDVLINCPNIIEIINNIPHKKVFIPFTHYNHDASFMKNLPFDMSNAVILDKLTPLELHSVLGQMSYVIVSSLHASIFSYTQNTPFISMYQKKVQDYFNDRELGKYVYSTEEQLTSLIAEFEQKLPDMSKMIEIDKQKVHEYVDMYATIIKAAPSIEYPVSVSHESTVHRLELYNYQLELVIQKRDVLMHNQIYRGIRSRQAVVDELGEALKVKDTELSALKNDLRYIKRHPMKFAVRKIAKRLTRR